MFPTYTGATFRMTVYPNLPYDASQNWTFRDPIDVRDVRPSDCLPRVVLVLRDDWTQLYRNEHLQNTSILKIEQTLLGEGPGEVDFYPDLLCSD
jgi:hypothetical protein